MDGVFEVVSSGFSSDYHKYTTKYCRIMMTSLRILDF
jgi:hypothetical protein